MWAGAFFPWLTGKIIEFNPLPLTRGWCQVLWINGHSAEWREMINASAHRWNGSNQQWENRQVERAMTRCWFFLLHSGGGPDNYQWPARWLVNWWDCSTAETASPPTWLWTTSQASVVSLYSWLMLLNIDLQQRCGFNGGETMCQR